LELKKMLRRVDRIREPTSEAEVEAASSNRAIDFDQLLSAARRQARVLVIAAIIGLLIGVVYSVTAVPQYTATTNLLIDGQKGNRDVSGSIAELTFDTGAIDSQVEVLKSEKIALSVIGALKLTGDPEFTGPRGSLLGQALGILRSAFDFKSWFVTRENVDPEEQFNRQRAAIGQLESNLGVRRVARTYVLGVEYTSPDPAKAASIANGFAEAYLTDQLDSKYESSRRATGWMQSRIAQLKSDAMASDSAVQKYKADNGITTVKGGSTNDTLVSDQQMTELNTQLMGAHSETARAEARYNQIEEMLKSGQTDGAVTDSLGNPVVTDLRQKYLQASKLESELESKVGPNHLQVVTLRRNMAEYQRLMFEELKRIGETYRSEGEVARAKEDSLNSSLAALVGQSAGTDQTMVQLRELEREADTYRTLHTAFLQRYQETIQQQTFPMTEARVITVATPPAAPSYPKRSVILTLSLLLGAVAGVGVGALREYRDRVFRVASQVRDELGIEFLGMLPAAPSVMTLPSEPRGPREIASNNSMMRYSIDHPLSSFSETLRVIKVACDLSLGERKPKVIGMVSVLPNEGKSTVSKNFASLLAHLGAKTMLIDGDLRNPGLTRSVAAHAEAGILEAIRRSRLFGELLLTEADSGLSFLPAVVGPDVHHTSEVLASPGMRAVLREAGQRFDYIVVDLPPIGPVIDVRAAAAMFDGFIFVIEWGKTSRMMVKNVLAADDALRDKCIGAVFNKVQMSQIKLYESHGSKDYYNGRYSNYYRNGTTKEKESA
jgi:polysaccharide biosynthesis transport protein